MWTTFSTPVTPTRDSASGMPGVRAWTSSPLPVGTAASVVGEPACTASQPSVPPPATRPVARFCDLRFWYHFRLRADRPFGAMFGLEDAAAQRRKRREAQRKGGLA